MITQILNSTIAYAQELELGAQDAKQVLSSASLFPYAKLTTILFLLYVFLGVCLFAYFVLKRKKQWVPPILLRNFPTSAKAAILLTVFAYCLVHIFALIEIYIVTKIEFKSTSEYFYYMKLPKLLATSHAHFFGHGTMYLITSLIFLFSNLSESWKTFFIVVALSSGLLDVPSWWAIKYAGDNFELFSAVAGTMSVVGWGFMAARIMYEICWQKPTGATS